MIQYKRTEFIFHSPSVATDDVNVELQGIFTIGDKVTTVKGYGSGDGSYTLRYTPMEAGECSYVITSTLELEEIEGGTLTGHARVEEAGDNCHGPVGADDLGFVYADGKEYMPFGTTVYALVHQTPELIRETMDTLKTAPFNKVRMCIFPKHFEFNHNEPEFFAFEKDEEGHWDVKRPCRAFWNQLDIILDEMEEDGIEADLILLHPYDCWGLSYLSREEYLTYMEYLIRRVSSHANVWWSLANEYDQMDGLTMEDWMAFARFLSENDVYHHMLSNHNFVHPWDFSDPYTTHVCLQQADAGKIPALFQKYHKPVIYDEMGYEGNIPYNWGNLSPFEMVNRFYKTFAMGGYATHGETYMEHMDQDQVLWWAKGGKLKGESIPRLAFMRQLFESLPHAMRLLDKSDTIPFHSQEELGEMVAENREGIADNLVFKCMSWIDKEEYQHMIEFFTQPIIHYEEETYFTYLGDMCTIYTTLQLPKDKTYQIEVIDVWEMTRTLTMTGVSGNVEIDLPGKAGIGILATREV